MAPASPTPPLTPPAGPAALFAGFFAIGISGFGGVLPWARRMAVEERRWLSPAEFTDLLALCQLLPGPNVVNLSVLVGVRFHGARGAVAAFFGLLAAPVVIVIGLGILYARFSDVPTVQRAFTGLAAAASGFVLANAVKIAAGLRGNAAGLAIAAIGFAAVALLRLPLFAVLVVLAALGVALAARGDHGDAAR